MPNLLGGMIKGFEFDKCSGCGTMFNLGVKRMGFKLLLSGNKGR